MEGQQYLRGASETASRGARTTSHAPLSYGTLRSPNVHRTRRDALLPFVVLQPDIERQALVVGGDERQQRVRFGPTYVHVPQVRFRDPSYGRGRGDSGRVVVRLPCPRRGPSSHLRRWRRSRWFRDHGGECGRRRGGQQRRWRWGRRRRRWAAVSTKVAGKAAGETAVSCIPASLKATAKLVKTGS